MLKAIRSTFFISSFFIVLTYIVTSASAQEKALSINTKQSIATEKIIDDILLEIERLQAVQDCRNLMGKYIYYHVAMRHKDYVELWSKREDSCLELCFNIYDAWESVRRCYVEAHGERSNPGMDEEMKGAMHLHDLDSEVVVVADDGKTARGCWTSPGHETRGAGVTWCWGRYIVDFIKEDGVWKIWHMRLFPYFNVPHEDGWVKAATHERVGLGDADRPSSADHWLYKPTEIIPPNHPEPPLPYKTYDDIGLDFIDPKPKE